MQDRGEAYITLGLRFSGVDANGDSYTEAKIKKAYHQMARKTHPDKNSSENAEIKFKKVAAAYSLLTSTETPHTARTSPYRNDNSDEWSDHQIENFVNKYILIPRLYDLSFEGSLIYQQSDSANSKHNRILQINGDGKKLFTDNKIYAPYFDQAYLKSKIIIGYLKALPFQIIVHILEVFETVGVFLFIDSCVLPLMARYAENLSSSSNSDSITNEFIHAIYSSHTKFFANLPMPFKKSGKFAMSLGVTYSKNNELYFAGFGIGDTGLTLLTNTHGFNKTTQLAYITSINLRSGVDSFYDAFDSKKSREKIDVIIQRNNKFNIKVIPGNKVFAYSEIHDSRLTVKNRKYSNCDDRYNVEASFDIYEREGLGSSKWEDFSLLNTAFCNHYSYMKDYPKDFCLREHTMIGVVTIPKKSEQEKLAKELYQQVKERYKQVLDTKKNIEPIHTLGTNFLDAIEILEKEPTGVIFSELTGNLVAAHQALSNPTNKNLNVLRYRAQQTWGKSSPCLQAFGVAMMVLGVGLAILGVIVLAGSLGATLSGFLAPLGTLGIATGAGLVAGGGSVFTTGLGLFAHGRQKGISKKMVELVDECYNCRSVPEHCQTIFNPLSFYF